jgi:hypothetical protein
MVNAEEKVAAYEAAGEPERKLARDLARKGTKEEVDLLLEIYHYFPGTRLVKNAPSLPPPASRG